MLNLNSNLEFFCNLHLLAALKHYLNSNQVQGNYMFIIPFLDLLSIISFSFIIVAAIIVMMPAMVDVAE